MNCKLSLQCHGANAQDLSKGGDDDLVNTDRSHVRINNATLLERTKREVLNLVCC